MWITSNMTQLSFSFGTSTLHHLVRVCPHNKCGTKWPIFGKLNMKSSILQVIIHSNSFDIHGSVHRRWLSRNTNKMQLCNRIYYSKVYWRLNMFQAAHRSSPGALNCICSLWFIYPCGDRPLPRLSGKWISHSTLATLHLVGCTLEIDSFRCTKYTKNQ